MRADEAGDDGEAMPAVTLWLGLGGLIPFLVLAGALVLDTSLPLVGDPDAIRQALMVYAVAILSFLGGVRWGIAMGYADGKVAVRDFLISVIPAILGWAAALLPLGPGLWLMTAAFILLGLYDYGLACRTVAPEWYGRLRLALTAAVSAMLAMAALS
ncbi:MAG: DUF3429 domain-containing protein [Phreatobacter sp.]|nr:DUF3429 domain-containing protein [Phreatobacter sp.]